jgi:hypothetical protein
VTQPSPLRFFGHLRWLDGRPLLDTIENYRRKIFTDVFCTFDDTGRPLYNFALLGRAKKNWKSADLVLAALFRLLACDSSHGNDCYIVAQDHDQARDDLALAAKVCAANPIIADEVECLANSIRRLDGKGALITVASRYAAGLHGKTYSFCGFDEIHGLRDHALFEALAPDPSRPEALIWVTSYRGIAEHAGTPIYDLYERAKAGADARMYFSWYSGDFTTDPSLRSSTVTPEQRANPSIANFEPGYLEQQKARLPSNQYRRLHLNLPSSPAGAAYSAEAVMNATMTGVRQLPHQPSRAYRAFVDMSGGSFDDASLAISHYDIDAGKAVLDAVFQQLGEPPFDPNRAVTRFASLLRSYGLSQVSGDPYGGQTFKNAFLVNGISFDTVLLGKSELYEALEPRLNSGEILLVDEPKLREQLLG